MKQDILKFNLNNPVIQFITKGYSKTIEIVLFLSVESPSGDTSDEAITIDDEDGCVAEEQENEGSTDVAEDDVKKDNEEHEEAEISLKKRKKIEIFKISFEQISDKSISSRKGFEVSQTLVNVNQNQYFSFRP